VRPLAQRLLPLVELPQAQPLLAKEKELLPEKEKEERVQEKAPLQVQEKPKVLPLYRPLFS